MVREKLMKRFYNKLFLLKIHCKIQIYQKIENLRKYPKSIFIMNYFFIINPQIYFNKLFLLNLKKMIFIFSKKY